MKILFLAFFVLLPTLTRAQYLSQEECSDTDIRETNPKIRDNPQMVQFFSEPRNQDSIGWCYGFSAADLMSAEIGTPVSSIHSSVLYNKSVEKNFFMKIAYDLGDLFMSNSFKEVYEGGFASGAMKAMVKNKMVCTETDLPFDQNYGYDTYGLIKSMEKLKDEAKANKLVRDEVCKEVDKTIVGLYNTQVDTEMIATSLINENLNITLDKLAAELCKDKMVPVPKLKSRSIRRADKKKPSSIKKFLSKVNEVLDKGKPLEMSYNVKHYTEQSGMHSSVIMSRRWNNGRCEYRVRNSWGQSCAWYKANVSCDHKSGSYWISDEDFVKGASGINYLD